MKKTKVEHLLVCDPMRKSFTEQIQKHINFPETSYDLKLLLDTIDKAVQIYTEEIVKFHMEHNKEDMNHCIRFDTAVMDITGMYEKGRILNQWETWKEQEKNKQQHLEVTNNETR